MSSSATRNACNMVLQTHRTIQSFRNFRRTVDPSKKIGFVPTMGALHEGHLSLVKAARENNDIVIASIYVNPTQFGVNEDLDKYPRALERDTKILNEMGVDHLFAPSEMYGKHHVCYVEPEGFDAISEGQVRPGHFRGVATIVNKLFNIVQPTNSYFGQKDAAQCVLIKRLVSDLDLDINVCIMDTIREEDGLAMSSRNTYLTDKEREAAVILYKSLTAAQDLFDDTIAAAAEHDDRYRQSTIQTSVLQETVMKNLLSEKLVSNVEYVSVDSKETMRPLDLVDINDGAIISIACRVGKVRLIDNFIL